MSSQLQMTRAETAGVCKAWWARCDWLHLRRHWLEEAILDLDEAPRRPNAKIRRALFPSHSDPCTCRLGKVRR
jgi:hypothetical protein